MEHHKISWRNAGENPPAFSPGNFAANHVEKCKVVVLIEPRREKTGFLHMRKQRRRSASR